MDRVDAYSRLFNLRDDDRLDVDYYVKMLSRSAGDVPEEIVEFLVENDPDYTSEAEEYPGDGDDYRDGLLEPDDGEPDEVAGEYDEDPIRVEIEPSIVVNDRPDDPDLVAVEDSDGNVDGDDIEYVDVDDVIREFVGHLRKTPVFRKIRNSDDPKSLCKTVSSFCTRYFIELHSSEYGSELVKEAIATRIGVGEILRLLADYVDYGDLNALARSVVVVRNFLEPYIEED